ncbi:MAG: hydroxymethylpyrimidine/phosphomethylpyrimidine kinase [Bacteroidetes bacterium]|nr:hydroxymethylpyrimidine/phosphomethylpyrimidine kinase [Bacteroidota bacterium]
MSEKRPYVLSIAGFDPSGGAGITADIKTFEANKVYGLGICSALTFQNDENFEGVDWISLEKIIKQIEMMQKKYRIDWIKIGLIENFDVLEKLVLYLKEIFKGCKIIWDPILNASAGFIFHESIEVNRLEILARNLFLITPNWDEIQKLYPGKEPLDGAKRLSRHCNVFLKGGHNIKAPGRDYLFLIDSVNASGKNYIEAKSNGKMNQFSFRPKEIIKYAKHGSGCVLSAAITANLARGWNLHRACLRSKNYITKFLSSSESLLGFHKI